MAHEEKTTGSSPIVKGVVNNLREILPEAQRQRLDGYASQVEATTPKGDYRRARYCLKWAIQTAERPEHSHLSKMAILLKEKHKAYQDVWLGTEFGFQVEIGKGQASRVVKGDQRAGPGEDIELLWVEEATDVAKRIAGTSGWDTVPWEELLQHLIEIS
jgi:hypothetical protein